MQVVYSGGSTTPSPSPRTIRKSRRGSRYIRPIMPAYFMHNLPPRSFAKCQSKVKPSGNKDTTLRDFIPAMAKPVAITCLVCNILFPGLGTFISGLTLMCGSQVRPPEKTRCSIIWTNTWVAGLQLITTFLFLLGWIWSITWGIAFLTISDEYSSSAKVENPVIEDLKHNRHSNGTSSNRNGNSSNNCDSHTDMMTTATTMAAGSIEKPSDDVIIALTETPPMFHERAI